ncbi:uncharacterized protein uimc1 isoform X4 [Genypterus blacodes]|uniref:uncharacterized protein uimc1 isoform X4 n=1 Tax=Genypterus blacodes TaxID=154954 RepID=UPI003F759557
MPATFPLSHQYNEESQEDDCENDEDDNIEENCSSSLPLLQSSSRGKRRRERERQPKPREMTEEEMMDLALRLSQQEASVAALKLQQEEEAVMKAIEESMVSQTQPCPSSQSQSLLSDAALVLSSRRKLLCTNGTANSQGVSADGCTSDTDVTRAGDGNNHRGKKRKRKDGSPLLEMPDVSQAQKKESQASAFITDPLSVPLDTPQGNKIDRSQDDGIVQSDVEEEPKQVSMDWKSSRAELTSNMTLHWSDEDDEGDCEVSPSPIFPKERATHHQPDSHSASTNHTAAAAGTARLNCSPNPRRCGRVTGAKEVQHPSTSAKGGNGLNKCFSFGPSSSSSSTLPSQQQQVPAPSATGQEARPDHSQGPVATPTVHYYWGVPFCPRGLEPDAYTQVILAQLEVYEKSLKQAQRCLLRKAEWGEAILPQPEKSPSPESPVGSPEQPPLRRRGLRLRGRKMRKSPSLEEDDKKDSEEEEHREKVNNEEEQGVEVDIDDCDVCPETQLSNDDDNTQDLTQGTDVTAEPKPQSPALPEIEFVLRKDGPHQGGSQEEVMEVDGPVDGRKEGDKSQNVRRDEEEGSRGAEVEEIEDKVLQKLISAELKASAAPQLSKPSIACPLCQGSFPLTEIEMHAAYCDGEVTIMEERRPEADCFQVSLKPRRKRSRKAEAAEETQDLSGLSNRANQRQEKCYVCHKAVLLRDYSRHTEECIPPRASNASNRGDLLSALEQTESREPEAGPSSGSKLQPRDVIDLRDEDEDGEGSPDMSAFRISRSPIRAFTPISEASDCLVDFKKQQQVKKPSRRPR